MIPQSKTVRVKNRPNLTNKLELKSDKDLFKVIKVENLVCLYEDKKEKIYFVQNFFVRQKKK